LDRRNARRRKQLRRKLLRPDRRYLILPHDMSNRISDSPPPRFSVSQLPAEVDPVEKDFARLLTQALAPSFVLVKRLGAGGMGAVYLARDPLLRRLVAVKVLAPNLASDPEARARFEREGQAVAAISHPNVVNVHSVGELENGVPYIVMQYVEGPTLADRLKQDGPFQARQAKHIIGEVASALAAAHKKGIVHRDIKPSNIILDEDTGRAMVTDFGIAAVKQKEKDEKQPPVDLTQAGVTLGTPAYMSPEQLLAEPTTDKTDIYALGLLGYELFIAEGPYQVSSPKEMMAAHLRDTPRSLSAMRGDIDPELARLLENCLHKDPTKRPTAAEAEKRLEHGAAVLLEWPPPGLERFRAMIRTTTRVIMAGAFVFAIPLVLLSVFDRESVVRHTLPPMTAMYVITALGLITFLVGLGALGVFLGRAREKVRGGYGWGTIFEVVADRRGDTGALIAGAREYAEMEPQRRNAMRRNRLIALVLRLIGSVLPVAGYFLGVAFAARSSGGPTIVLWSSVLLALTLLAEARVIAWQEDRALTAARQRRRSAHARPSSENLAETWTESFEQVRLGQRMGAGPRWQGKPVKVTTWLALGVVGAFGVLMFMIFTLTSLVHIAGNIAYPNFSRIRGNVFRLQRLADYRIPADASITPLRAGQALHAIVRNGPGSTRLPFEREPVITIPPQREVRLTDPFPTTGGGWANHAFRKARRGFTLQERDYLRALADNTALEEFRTLARAPGLDFNGAYWDLTPDAIWMELPTAKGAPIRQVASANLAQAALDLSDGRTQLAEQRVRETLSAGFQLMEHGRVVIENLFGAAIVGQARHALTALYEVTGRERDARFVSPENDPEPPANVGTGRFTVEDIQRSMRAQILDTTMLTGVRWELLQMLAFEPCTDLHQVIFGPDSLHRATMAEAKRTMVKRASDSALFATAERITVVPMTARGSRGAAVRATRPITRATSLLTGNRQLESCLSLFGV
jgi:hypothetical protein